MSLQRRCLFLFAVLALTAGASCRAASLPYIPFISSAGVSAAAAADQHPAEKECELLKLAYPGIKFSMAYDIAHRDWRLTVESCGKTVQLYRAGGRYLTEKELVNKEKYLRVLYPYSCSVRDPSDFSEETADYIRRTVSAEHARTAGSALFSAIYDADSRESAEKHLCRVMFFGKSVTVNERIVQPLARAEDKIRKAASSDQSVASFRDSLLSADAYSWSADRTGEEDAFHSFGAAIDIFPKGAGRLVVYWKFEKDRKGDAWIRIPPAERWAPPEKVIRIFEGEGFIWGGNWTAWNNMHFEYRPEQIIAARNPDLVQTY